MITVRTQGSCGYLTESPDIGAKSHAILAVHIATLLRSDYRIARLLFVFAYSKTCVKQPMSKRQHIDFQDPLSLHTGQKYCRMLKESILQYFRPSLSYHLS